MMHFEITGDLAKVRDLQIDANFAELNEWLEGELAQYRTLVVVPDNISGAKADRARIRKIAERIDEQRKMVKKAYMEPYTEFEAKCKQPIALCNEVVKHIDVQIKEYEAEKKRMKEVELQEHFEELAKLHSVTDFIEWADAFTPRWLNTTFSIDDVKKDIEKLITATKDDVEVIRTQEEKYVPMLLQYYGQTHDLAATLRELSRLKAIEQREAERKKANEEAQAKMKKAMESVAKSAQKAAESVKALDKVLNSEEVKEKVYTLGFKVKCTERQLNALKAFLINNGIKYGPIE